MKKTITNLLTKGLLSGFAGKSEFQKVLRSEFSGVSSNFNDGSSNYHDEWFVPTHLGGGQELVKNSNGQMFTRLYGGGSLTEDQIKKLELDITSDQISSKLKESILKLKDKTRIFNDIELKIDDNWEYKYKVIYNETNIPVIIAVETIEYKKVVVHSHPFILCPVE